MSRIPTVAIIGRPNTGKSTLFNRLVGRRLAIENAVAGTTRDQIAARVEGEELDYLVVDTGGIGGGSTDKDLEDDVSRQSVLALETADLILFTLNGREELTASDQKVIDILRKQRKAHVPVLLVITKCDTPKVAEARIAEFQALGITDDVLLTSAAHGIGILELEETITERLRTMSFEKQPKLAQESVEPARIAIVGTPNVGKSSLINALMSDPQRETAARIVSEIPGTTRDATDTVIKHDGQDYVFVDTAGLRRKARVEADIEYFSNLRSIQAIGSADIAVLVLDAQLEISRQEKRIANMAAEEGKGLIIIMNKSDKIDADMKQEKQVEIAVELPFARFAPVLFTSAKTRENLPKLFALIESVRRNRLRRLPTKDLRRWFDHSIQRLPAKALSKTKFLTQAEEVPPTFVLFVNNPKAVKVSELKFMEKSLRQTFAFEGTPIRFITKQKPRDEARERDR